MPKIARKLASQESTEGAIEIFKRRGFSAINGLIDCLEKKIPIPKAKAVRNALLYNGGYEMSPCGQFLVMSLRSRVDVLTTLSKWEAPSLKATDGGASAVNNGIVVNIKTYPAAEPVVEIREG